MMNPLVVSKRKSAPRLYERFCNALRDSRLFRRDPAKFSVEDTSITPVAGDPNVLKREILLCRIGGLSTTNGELDSETGELKTSRQGGETMRVHGLTGYMSNLYVVEYPERGETLLLDAGVASDFQRIDYFVKKKLYPSWSDRVKTALSDRDCTTTNHHHQPRLTMALSTHCHVDHVGSLEQHLHNGTFCVVSKNWHRVYKKGFTGSLQRFIHGTLSVWVANRLSRGVEWVWHQKALPNWLFTPVPPPGKGVQEAMKKKEDVTDMQATARKLYPLKSPIQLEDLTNVPGFEDWISILAPGHTAHMTILYHPETRILYAADLTISHKGKLLTPAPLDNHLAHNHTLHRLRSLDVKFLLLAHGGILDVDDKFGGWQNTLDLIFEHFRIIESGEVGKQDQWFDYLMKQFILEGLNGWSHDAADMTRDKLPRRPLPAAWDPPAQVIHLK